jgi:uncharacterized membrane protein YeaQ/YmgE (transglycosylase-associated protein family)
MGILSWILMGLIVGILAKLIMPGKENMGIIVTILLGIVGAFFGGWLASLLGIGTVSGFDLKSILIAIGGAIIVLLIYNQFRKK